MIKSMVTVSVRLGRAMFTASGAFIAFTLTTLMQTLH